MSSSKALLKSAKDKLNKKDFAGAKDTAERVLDYESGNYMACVIPSFDLGFWSITLFRVHKPVHLLPDSRESDSLMPFVR